MEAFYNKLRQKEVVSLTDGRHLGKVCDMVFCYPENRIGGFVVTGCKGFSLTRQEVFIPIENIVKIGDDVILTDFCIDEQICENGMPSTGKHNKCKGQQCPSYPRNNNSNNSHIPYEPHNSNNPHNSHVPHNSHDLHDPRRSYEEYE